MKELGNKKTTKAIAARLAVLFITIAMLFTSMPLGLLTYANEAEDTQATTEQSTDAASQTQTQTEPKDKAAETPKEEPKKETSKNDSKETAKKETAAATKLSAKENGVTVKLSADAGVFPEGATLSVNTISKTEQKKVDAAIDAEKKDEQKVAASYTFDIKVLDANGKEVQPADGKSVNLSFTTDEVADDNLSTRVFHVDEEKNKLNATELSVSTEGSTATVETDGFSYYTVEFTYGDKQFVLEGDGVVKLDDLLKSIGIEGEVKGTKVSNSELFDVIRGTKDGVKYLTIFEKGKTKKVPVNNPDGKVRYVVSYKPFQTEEWLDVTMTDGATYHIVVTDAITGNGTNNDPIEGVSQGVGENFAETIPVADVWIDEQIINKTVQARMVGDHDTWKLKWVPGELMDPDSDKYDKGFQVDDSGSDTEKGAAQYEGNHFIIYDTNKKALDGSITTTKNDGTPAVQSYNYFEGEVGTYIWENAAIRANPDGSEEPLDVWITYSNPMITLETETNATEAPSWTGVKVGLFGPNIMTNGKDVNNGKRYALDIEVKPTVRDKQGNIVDGYFFYPMVHLNVDRTINENGNPMPSFQKFYKGNPDLKNYDERMHNYSEQVWLTDGLIANQSGDVIHIPGGSGDQMNYIPNILEEGGNYLIYPSPGNNNLAKNGENVILPDGTDVRPGDSFYFGFLSLVDNGEFKLRYNSSSGSTKAGMETYILSGTPFNYRLRHSTETLPSGLHPNPQPTDGGTIQTTRYGNHNGLLNEGERINPSIIATASGQTVVYTFYPNSGYGIRELWVWNDTDKTVHTLPTPQEMKDGAARRIRQGDGTNDTFVAHDDDNDGIPDRYTYEFSAIHADNAIHVVWGQTILEVTKNTTGSGGGDEDTFQFKIKAWTDDTSVTTPNPIDFTDSSDPEMNKRFKAMENGWYSFELTNGETLSVPPELIPVGYKWTVEEIGYEVGGETQWGKNYDDWKLVSDESISGEFISEETQYVHFTNNRKKAITGEKLTVKKVWKDDEKSIRPKNITMTIEKPGAIGVDSQEFGQAIRDLGNAKTVESIKYGTAVEYNTAKSTGKTIIEVEAESGRGEGKVFFWRDGNDVYFYSESEIYLLNSAHALFGDKENQGEDVYNFAALKDISGLEYVHTEFVEDMSNMFLNCYSLQDLSPLENWNTANVTNMAKMFGATNPNQSNKAMTYSDIKYLKNWQTQNVTNMRWMFRGAKSLSNLTYLSGWDTGRVQRMEQMFFRTSAGVNTNKSALENWNVQSVIKSPDNRFKEMFGYSVNQGQSKPDPANLPNWTNAAKPRAGQWNNSGTYNPDEGPEAEPAERDKNDEDKFFKHPHKDQKSLKSHDVDDSDPTGNTWIYEFEIPAGTTWDVYETLPKNVDDYYLVSTSYDNGKTGEEKETSGPHDGVGKKIEPFKGAQSGSITTITNTGKKHELKIKKDIPSNEDISQILPEEKTFTFTLTFTLGGKPYDIDDTQYQELHDTGSIERKSEGVYELKLIGRTAEEFILPAGVEYNVEETDSDGWTLLGSNHTHGTMNQDREASFINSKSDTVNVIKKWEGDRYNDAVFPTRPTELDSLGIKITTLDTMTRWKTAGDEKHVYSGDSYFSAIKDKYNEQNIDPEVMAADGKTPYTPTMEHPKYVKLDTAIGPFDAGDYVIDEVNETHYRVMPVENVPVERTYTDLAYGEEWDEDDDWLYEYDIPKTEKVIKVEETQVPDYYQETLPVIEDDGTVTFNIINTLETKNLRIEKETVGDEAGEFEFGIKFWVDNSTEKRHPVKIGHSQILTKNNEGEEITEAEFTFENGITIGGKDVAGVFELIDGEISGQNLHPGGTKPTMEQLDAIISALRTIEEGAADDDFPQHKKTNKNLSNFGLKWNGQDTQIVYVDQDSEVVENLFTNGRRLDWYIIPTPGHDEVITIRTPYALRTADNDDGAKQLPDGVRGNEDTGTYYFKIPNDGHITFPNLPAGVSYDIVEYKYHDWDLINTEGEVTGQLLEEGDTRRVKFTNEKKKGAVKIAKKTMYNTPGTFKFLVKMWEGEGDRIKYMDLSSQGATPLIGQDGLFEFTLDNGKEKTFEDIPYGYSYEVWEDGQDGWELVSVDDNEDITKAKGVVNGETVKHTFKNKGPIIYPTEEKKVTRTIHFTYEKKNGKQVTGKVVQEVTISRKALELDPETGEVTKWGPWSSATFPAVKNPDKEAGPGWATKDVAPALTINGPVEVKDVYIIYHRTDGSGGADTGDRNNVAIWIAIMAVAVVIALAVIIRRRRNNQ